MMRLRLAAAVLGTVALFLAGTPALAFSLTHTRGLVACAVTRGHAVGIDVEGIRPVPSAQHIADTRMTASEAASLASCAPEDLETRFLELWTLKEAYSKALGLGLQLPLDSRAFGFTGSSENKEEAMEEESLVPVTELIWTRSSFLSLSRSTPK